MKVKIAILLMFIAFSGCSIQKLAIGSMTGVMDYGLESMNEESDLPLAEISLASNLKLLDALIKADPDNTHLLLLASQAYSSYALGFVEDQDAKRAKVFYQRGRDYALHILDRKKEFAQARNGSPDQFDSVLTLFSKDDVPAIFWAASAWGSYVNVSMDDPAALADLPKVLSMMKFVVKNDSTYYNGFALAFFGVTESVTPKMMGGNPDRAKVYFNRCMAINDGRFLLTQVFYAKYYAVATMNQELFQTLLQQVIDASPDILPEQRLATMIAKRKAKALLEKTQELF